MAIPQPDPTRSSTRRAVVLVSLLFGVLSSTYALLSWLGVGLPDGWRPPGPCPSGAAGSGCPSCPTCPGAAAGASAAQAGPDGREVPAERPQRFVVCEASSGSPRVTRLALSQAALPVLGIHCGTSVHLVALDHDRPRRILQLDGLAVPPGLSPVGGALLAADVSGDARSELIVGTLLVDERESPRGGALHQLRGDATAAFEPARLLAPLSVGAAAAGALEPGRGLDLVVLQLEDARLARPNQLIVLRGGPAPVQLLALPTAVGADQLAVVDLDLNGAPEVVLAGRQRAAELIELDAQGQLLRRSALDVATAFELLTADMDGDGHDDLVLAAADARVLLASRESSRASRAIGSLEDWRSLQAFDWNADQRLDLIGQRGQAVMGLIQSGSLAFEVRELARLPAEVVVHALLALPAISKSDPFELVVVTSSARAASPVEIQRVTALSDVGGPARSVPLPNAPLSQHSLFP